MDNKLVKIDQALWDNIKKINHKILAIWARDMALRTIHFYEEKYPQDKALRKGMETLDLWLENKLSMMQVRQVVLTVVLPAARKAKADGNRIAEAAARACAQGVATAHVPSHSLGASIYALTAIKRYCQENNIDAQKLIAAEHQWQLEYLNELSQTR